MAHNKFVYFSAIYIPNYFFVCLFFTIFATLDNKLKKTALGGVLFLLGLCVCSIMLLARLVPLLLPGFLLLRRVLPRTGRMP